MKDKIKQNMKQIIHFFYEQIFNSTYLMYRKRKKIINVYKIFYNHELRFNVTETFSTLSNNDNSRSKKKKLKAN